MKMTHRCCVIAAALAQVLTVPLHAEEKVHSQALYEAAKRDYRVTKGYYDECRVTPARYFASLRRLMGARLTLCATKDEKIAVINENLAIAVREIALEEGDLEGSRPYTRDRGLEYAKGFLIECGSRLNQLTGAP